jgi:hypothetical protein
MVLKYGMAQGWCDMGVDFFDCSICGDSVCDAGEYGYCEKCGAHFCEDCDEDQKVKYNVDKLVQCDMCSYSNRMNRIRGEIKMLLEIEHVPEEYLHDLMEYTGYDISVSDKGDC